MSDEDPKRERQHRAKREDGEWFTAESTPLSSPVVSPISPPERRRSSSSSQSGSGGGASSRRRSSPSSQGGRSGGTVERRRSPSPRQGGNGGGTASALALGGGRWVSAGTNLPSSTTDQSVSVGSTRSASRRSFSIMDRSVSGGSTPRQPSSPIRGVPRGDKKSSRGGGSGTTVKYPPAPAQTGRGSSSSGGNQPGNKDDRSCLSWFCRR